MFNIVLLGCEAKLVLAKELQKDFKMKTNFTKGNWLTGVNHEITDDSAARNEIATVEIWDQRPWVSDANLKLIAAAPEMFEALRLARKYVGNQLVDLNHDGNEFVSIKDIIDAVIDKVTGAT